MTTTYYDSAGNELDTCDLQELYQDALNATYGDVDVCGLEYPAGYVLSELNPREFETGLAEWIDSETGYSIHVENPYTEED